MKKRYLTKVQAENIFKEEYKEFLKTATPTDKRCMWNDFTDILCRDGQISEYQYNTWSHPQFCNY